MELLAKLITVGIIIVICFTLFLYEIRKEPTLSILVEKSSKYVGTTFAHNLGYNGSGIKIAVIDTGVDYTHPDLLGFGKDGKVIGGYDFVENDEFPQDTNGHGTQVAGIIAANGKLVGIAPAAKILAYRVSDSGESVPSNLIVKAIRRAVSDGANIINISLGVNKTNDKIDDAINEAVSSGVVVVAAAGNSGPGFGTIGSPGKDPNAITVGATYNNLTASLVATLQIDGKRFQVIPMVGTSALSSPIEAELVFAKYGRPQDLRDIDAHGKILLVERGSDNKNELVYFSQKEKNSANAGAKAVIIYNNEPGIFVGDLKNKLEGPDYKPRIPAVSISREDGLIIKNMLQNKTTGVLNTFYHPDFVSFFSSRGPVSPFYIKPNLVAPGVFVNTTSILGKYNLTSGTSFAAPHVSGAVAILLQKNPGLQPSEVASIISTTADPISDTVGVQFAQELGGVGRLNVTTAVNANLVISPPFVIFDLSPFSKTQLYTLNIKTLNNQSPKLKINVDVDPKVAIIDSNLNSNTVQLKATLSNSSAGQYEGSITIHDDTTTYHVPVLLRISEGAIKITENKGRLDFFVDMPKKWTFAKVTLYDVYSAKIVGSTSMTPKKSDSFFITKPGTYWVQAEVRTAEGTVNLYNQIQVKSAEPHFKIDFGIPNQQLVIVISIITSIAVVGFLLQKIRVAGLP